MRLICLKLGVSNKKHQNNKELNKMEEDKEEKTSTPREEYIFTVLEVLERFGAASAREIDSKLKDKESLKKLGISYSKDKIPSYPTITRILHYLDAEKGFVKWIPAPTKEKKYKITKEGQAHLAGYKCDTENELDMLFYPANCRECKGEQIELCWTEYFEQLNEWIKKGIIKESLVLNDSNKKKIKEILKEPSGLAQICSYYKLSADIEPFFKKHLKPIIMKVVARCGK